MPRAKQKPKPKLLLSVIFFYNNPTISWSLKVVRGKQELTITDGRVAFDPDAAEFICMWEELGAEIAVSRYKEGTWTTDKPWTWYTRFKQADNNE